MQLGDKLVSRMARGLALLSLWLGLFDAASLLGVWDGRLNPIVQMGLAGFVYHSVFALGLLFAAVGLWLLSSWGAVVLLGTLLTHLLLALSGNPSVGLNALGVSVRVLMALAAAGLLIWVQLKARDLIND